MPDPICTGPYAHGGAGDFCCDCKCCPPDSCNNAKVTFLLCGGSSSSSGGKLWYCMQSPGSSSESSGSSGGSGGTIITECCPASPLPEQLTMSFSNGLGAGECIAGVNDLVLTWNENENAWQRGNLSYTCSEGVVTFVQAGCSNPPGWSVEIRFEDEFEIGNSMTFYGTADSCDPFSLSGRAIGTAGGAGNEVDFVLNI